MRRNQQAVPEEWILEMTSPKLTTESSYSFGYYWWIDTERNIYFMWGHGGQFAFTVPDKNLLVVITAIPNTQGDYQILAEDALPLVDLIIESGR